jgi:hypothetical protein
MRTGSKKDSALHPQDTQTPGMEQAGEKYWRLPPNQNCPNQKTLKSPETNQKKNPQAA